MAPFTRSDLEMFARFRIDLSLLEEGRIERLTDMEARQYGFTASVDESLDGIAFPYYSLATGQRVTARLRRDNPLVKMVKRGSMSPPTVIGVIFTSRLMPGRNSRIQRPLFHWLNPRRLLWRWFAGRKSPVSVANSARIDPAAREPRDDPDRGDWERNLIPA